MAEYSYESWERLASMLREELAAFGELFSILEAQRSFLLERDLDAFIGANEKLQSQADRIRLLRDRRDEFRKDLGAALGIEESGSNTIKALVRRAPEKFLSLFDSLIGEIERLTTATRDYLKRNQMLVRRAYDTNRQFLSLVANNGAQTSGYGRNGALDRPGHQNMAATYLARA